MFEDSGQEETHLRRKESYQNVERSRSGPLPLSLLRHATPSGEVRR